jgi:hypothetical protein
LTTCGRRRPFGQHAFTDVKDFTTDITSVFADVKDFWTDITTV